MMFGLASVEQREQTSEERDRCCGPPVGAEQAEGEREKRVVADVIELRARREIL